MRPFHLSIALLVLVVFAGCSSSGPEFDPQVQPGVFEFDFETGRQGWVPIFVGIPKDKEGGEDLASQVETESDHRSLPDEVEKEGQALFSSGFIGSPEMGLYFKRRIDGLTPDTEYRVRFEVSFASNIPSNCGGFGGIPGTDPVLALAVQPEPVRIVEEGELVDKYQFNEPVRNLVDARKEAATLGEVGIDDLSCEDARARGWPYRMKQLEGGEGLKTVRTNEAGRAWVLVGTITNVSQQVSFYYDEITVRFETVNSQSAVQHPTLEP
jgi:hypothetical protein